MTSSLWTKCCNPSFIDCTRLFDLVNSLMKAVTRSSWKTRPIPKRKYRIEIELSYSDAEGERIKLGYIPKNMDNKWFICFKSGWLYFYRSWTGVCIYGIRLDASANGIRVTKAWVSSENSPYRTDGPEYDAELIKRLISILLLS